jgi:hypothetical protein
LEALADRRAGIPPGPPGAKALGGGRPFGGPCWLQGRADQRLPRPCVWGGQAQRSLVSAAAWRTPWASQRSGATRQPQLACQPPSVSRGERLCSIDACRVSPAVLLGHTTHRSETGLPGLRQQVWACVHRADIAPPRGGVKAFLAAANMPMDCRPGAVVPGRQQGLAIRCFRSEPRAHIFTLPHTGPTSAAPGGDSRPWLLRASGSPGAWGGHLLRAVTASQSATGGCSVPRCHGLAPEGGRGWPPGWSAVPTRQSLRLPAPPPVPFWLQCVSLVHGLPLTVAPPHRRCHGPEIPARRATPMEAARVRRFPPRQTVETPSWAWGLCCHSCPWREGLPPSGKAALPGS